jgi:GNAT superfamily N-acetyltransferase
MTVHLTDMTADHVDAAAQLLAAQRRAQRRLEPAYNPKYEDPEAVIARLTTLLASPTTHGMVAHRRSGPPAKSHELAGFLIATVSLQTPGTLGYAFLPPRTARVAVESCVAGDDAYDCIRELYAAFAPRWLAQGCFIHYAVVPSTDAIALAAWRSLGFGRTLAWAMRDLSPLPNGAVPEGVEIVRAQPSDLPDVARLVNGNDLYHTGPPIYAPFPPEGARAQWQAHGELLADGKSVAWLARREGRSVAVQTYRPSDESFTEEASIYLDEAYVEPAARSGGAGRALLAQGLDWARSEGYSRCTISWDTSNIVGARFWQRVGFRPLSYRLTRHVDPRIVWAGSS